VNWSLALLLLVSSPDLCGSCPCVILPGEDLDRPVTLVPRARREAKAIFAGRVIAVDTLLTGERWVPSDTAPHRYLRRWAETVRYTFDVSEVWKGKSTAKMAVVVERANSSCGRRFAFGREYLVYAEPGARGLTASSCARVRQLSQATADLSVLGRGKRPD
jgi:hypothetical protein